MKVVRPDRNKLDLFYDDLEAQSLHFFGNRGVMTNLNPQPCGPFSVVAAQQRRDTPMFTGRPVNRVSLATVAWTGTDHGRLSELQS